MDRAPAELDATSRLAAWLLVRDERFGDQRYRLSTTAPTRIGRAPDNDIVLPDARCSRYHCEVAFERGCWVVRDRSSRNGTFVDHERVSNSYILEDGDEIEVGPHRLVFGVSHSPGATEEIADWSDTEDHIPVPGAPAAPTIIPPRKAPRYSPTVAAMESLVGESDSMRRLREQVQRIAPTDATVLIRGESGVGKELVARSLHDLSLRRATPLLCLNCAALSESLLESELFGHEKGAFTGATSRKLGKFELAHRGTLFLDEIGELSPAIQAKFLRVLEGQPFHRIGGSEAIRADVRVIAATNRDLEEAVKEHRFREDLYFRLNVVQVLVDPLRARPYDIPLLANHFLREAAAQARIVNPEISPAAMERLVAYRWPGNVRELKNTIYRAVILAQSNRLEPEDIDFCALSDDNFESAAAPPTLVGRSLQEVELSHILAVLEQTGWNKSRAAEILGIERSTLDRKLKRHDIQRPTGDRPLAIAVPPAS